MCVQWIWCALVLASSLQKNFTGFLYLLNGSKSSNCMIQKDWQNFRFPHRSGLIYGYKAVCIKFCWWDTIRCFTAMLHINTDLHFPAIALLPSSTTKLTKDFKEKCYCIMNTYMQTLFSNFYKILQKTFHKINIYIKWFSDPLENSQQNPKLFKILFCHV